MKTMRYIRLLSALACAAAFTACEKEPVTIYENDKPVNLCANPLNITLTYDFLVAHSSFSNNNETLFITIEAIEGLLITDAESAIFDCSSGDTSLYLHDPPATPGRTYTQAVPIDNLMHCHCIAGDVTFAEAANPANTVKASFMVEYCLDKCDGDIVECQYRTQTQGGWGSKPHGNNPGTYLHDHFAGAFPNGLTVGCKHTVTLTSADAVTGFLPQGGPAAPLTQSYTDYDKKINVLAGQLVALTLSVTFDDTDPDFGTSNTRLGDATIATGPFSGTTIDRLLEIANEAFGGCNTSYNITDINEALSTVNQNYVDGKSDLGLVNCPG